jgi:hypothetical protein
VLRRWVGCSFGFHFSPFPSLFYGIANLFSFVVVFRKSKISVLVFCSNCHLLRFYSMDNPQVSGEPPTPLTEGRPRTHFPDPKSLHTKGQFTLLHHYIKNIYTMTTSLPTLSWFLLLAWTTKSVSATFLFGQNTTQCLSPPDQFIGNAQRVFNMVIWVKRGTCIRGDNDFDCYHNVQYMLQNGLNDLRKAEYAGAAGVLALLPTIGALLGAPTNEIWRLLTLVPFGGVIAMFLSFGGAILPVRIQDYEMDFSKRRQARTTTIGDIDDHDGEEHLDYDSEDVRDNKKLKKERLERIVRRRLQQNESQHIPLQYISFGLTGMILFLFAAQVAMAIIEQGAIVAWWCDSTWWMHLWYFMGELFPFASHQHLQQIQDSRHHSHSTSSPSSSSSTNSLSIILTISSSHRHSHRRQLRPNALQTPMEALHLRHPLRSNLHRRRQHH